MVRDASLAETSTSGLHRVKHAGALVAVNPNEGGDFNDEVFPFGRGFAVHRLHQSAATLANRIDRPKELESLVVNAFMSRDPVLSVWYGTPRG